MVDVYQLGYMHLRTDLLSINVSDLNHINVGTISIRQ